MDQARLITVKDTIRGPPGPVTYQVTDEAHLVGFKLKETRPAPDKINVTTKRRRDGRANNHRRSVVPAPHGLTTRNRERFILYNH